VGFETQDVERKVSNILRILADSREALEPGLSLAHLKDRGVDLGERAVRYHLKLTDERGLTRLVWAERRPGPY